MIRKNNLPNTEDQSLKNVAKHSLKTMKKTRTKHPMQEGGRIFKYGFSGFARNIWLSSAATAVMSITMIILFITIVASVILSDTAEKMKEKIDITIYLKPQTSQEVLDQLKDRISQDKNIKSVETSTTEQEYEKLISENQDSASFINVLDDEMKEATLAELQSTMRIKVYDADNLDSINEIKNNDELFKKYVDNSRESTDVVNQTEISTIASWARMARTGGIVLAIIFLAISVLIIFSTIRMAIFSRREEIYMMKLVGADKRFIRGPFLVEAEICGLIAGIIAATASFFGFLWLAPKLAGYGINTDSIMAVLESNRLVLIYVVFMLVGIVIGRISARLAVSKYLHTA